MVQENNLARKMWEIFSRPLFGLPDLVSPAKADWISSNFPTHRSRGGLMNGAAARLVYRLVHRQGWTL